MPPIEIPAIQLGVYARLRQCFVDAGLVSAKRAAALQHQGSNLERQVVPRGHDLRLGLDLHVSSLRSSEAARAESPQTQAKNFNCSRSMPPALRKPLVPAGLPRTLPLSRESLRPEATRDLFS